MKLLDKLRDAWSRLGGSSGGGLRNRQNGMAWIKGLPADGTGVDALNGRAVRTVRVNGFGAWEIDPPQSFNSACAHPVAYKSLGPTSSWTLAYPGQTVLVTGVADDCLEPWKDTGVTKEEVRELFKPAPVRTTEPA